MSKEIIEKIRKLQAKAENSASSEAEAALFAAKVQELLVQHNIDMSVLDASERDEVSHKIEYEIYGGPYTYPWRGVVALEIARYYFCEVIIDIQDRAPGAWVVTKRLAFIGKAHNRSVAIPMYEYLNKTIQRLAREKWQKREDIMAFERGCGLALASRINKMTAEAKRVVPTSGANVPALYKGEDILVQDFINTSMKTKRSNNTYDLTSKAAYDGIRAADTIRINQELR